MVDRACFKSRQAQTILPWISPRRAQEVIGGRSGWCRVPAAIDSGARDVTVGPLHRAKPFLLKGNRLFWFVTILAATAVAALVITRVMIANGAGPGLTR